MESRLPDHECKTDIPPFPDTKVTLAFGAMTFPVLVTKLQSADAEVLRGALRASVRLLPTALNTTNAARAGAIPEFARLCCHEDTLIRQRASKALVIALKQGIAKDAFVKAGCLSDFKPVVTDPDTEVRRNALSALENLAYSAPWIHDMQKAGYVGLLVQQAGVEKDGATQALVLQTLAKVCNQGSPGQAEAVATGTAIATVIRVLMSPIPAVREGALRVLTQLSFTDEGKTIAIKENAVTELLRLMERDSSSNVRAEAAGAAMVIAVDNAAKLAFINGGLEPLVKLLADSSSIVRQNAMRAVSSIAAHPEGRPGFLRIGVEAELKRLIGEASGREKEIAEKTLAVVMWIP